ncbi:STAS domain-containing protein [Ilumatobacter coccineus]|uniref:Putative anti-sigma factor antagonist n=1 Tax=Ilumatobacter coccineus (strain NBRC 103263 / KCTC 29153 / YM16-304) TaxID=1313172 RepID=A0A6C7EE59_ILUCY|nr:STAS domain-containing protein [Ilumatobacter coccineus]BAN03449.1 putative anti-sigma factor antagonist [Ilumatobacter coccineus YM16-304]
MSSFRIERDGGTLVVFGDLDASTAPMVNDAVADTTGDIRLDLRNCTFVDSSGLNAIIAANNTAIEREAVLTLVEPSKAVLQLLRVCGMSDVFAIDTDD